MTAINRTRTDRRGPLTETRQANGREVSQATYWWWTHYRDEHRLCCIHGPQLNQPCDQCASKDA